MEKIVLLQSKIIDFLGKEVLKTFAPAPTPDKMELTELLAELRNLSKTIK